MHPKTLSIKDFTYNLPNDRIAYYPLPDRHASRLLIYENGKTTEDIYLHIANHLPADSVLIFNNSKVIEARLLFQKSTGGTIELFCLEPTQQYAGIAQAMQAEGKVQWECLVGGASKWKPGQVLKKIIDSPNGTIELSATYINKQPTSFLIEFSWSPAQLTFGEILHQAGAIPLPPYIKRDAEKIDTERYQTIYARYDGSVAAPTAGLHFTTEIFESLREKKIETAYVTLHVGAGTFKPVKSESMETHEMHAEIMEVTRDTIELILSHPESVIAVGTTSLRTLESLYWLGNQIASGNEYPGNIGQWHPYEQTAHVSPKAALESLLDWMRRRGAEHIMVKTQIIIAPGYQPRIVKGIVTNFHQPQSTLLLLVAALVGNDWRKIYEYALENNFRFLSYGDGCLLWISP